MDHKRTTAGYTAAKYVLGELSAEERTDFERHLFDCAECAGEVRAAVLFADNARAVFADEHRAVPVMRKGWFRWSWPAIAVPAAAAVLSGVVVYQSAVVIPGLRNELEQYTAPQPVRSVALHPVSRGGEGSIDLSRPDRFLQIVMDIDAKEFFPWYDCEIRAERASSGFSIRLPAPAPGRPLGLLLPARRLQPGSYLVTVRGLTAESSAQAGPPIDEYRFVVRQN